MDRIKLAAPVLLAAVALLGDSGARIGPFVVPELSFGWALAAVAVGVFLAKPSDEALGRRDAIVALLLVSTFVGLWAWRSSVLQPPLGLPVSVVIRDSAPRTVTADTLQLRARRDLRRLTAVRRNVAVQLDAVLDVPRDGSYRFEIDCDDTCRAVVGDHTFEASDTIELTAGPTPFSLRYRQLGGPAKLTFAWNGPAAVELLPIEYYISGDGNRRAQVVAAMFASILWWCAFSKAALRLAPRRKAVFELRLLPPAAAAVIILYGSLLRYDALLVHSGSGGHEHFSAWVPAYGLFNPANAPDDPYRADVRSYLDRAETFSLSRFYAPSFREPFYIALTLPFLALSGGEVGILVQSFFFSCATLVLLFVVARRLYGAWWAVLLLLPVSLHEWLVLEAPTGYRMSAYGFFLLATSASMFLWPATRKHAAAVGALAGLLCLIRLSALSVVAPLVALRIWSADKDARRAYGAVLLAMFGVVLAPFLISNTAAHGDPFYSISFHTQFWLRAEGLDASAGPVPWSRYFTDFGRAGAVIRGTFLGMTVLPVRTFWTGLTQFPLLNVVSLAVGMLGLVLAVGRRERFLMAAYLGHLVPFAYIQNFPSGEMPRFVMPAYLFLVLAAPVLIARIKPASAEANREGSPP